ncbi:unnamed protein product [Rhizoctonia solani]|uniref:Uncharacterized protein n=1 Tax=Rhizoctonia solani TaxID=456999 RepID=A0A8H3A5J2_9AGAM|nr:unnamed protein product [Rhizoctonia solani]
MFCPLSTAAAGVIQTRPYAHCPTGRQPGYGGHTGHYWDRIEHYGTRVSITRPHAHVYAANPTLRSLRRSYSGPLKPFQCTTTSDQSRAAEARSVNVRDTRVPCVEPRVFLCPTHRLLPVRVVVIRTSRVLSR